MSDGHVGRRCVDIVKVHCAIDGVEQVEKEEEEDDDDDEHIVSDECVIEGL